MSGGRGAYRPVLKYPGAKWSIAHWIVSHFPQGYEGMAYLEPFFGSGGVFFAKARSRVETVNDIDGDVVNLFRVMRDSPGELALAAYLTPWAREECLAARGPADGLGDVERARRFLARAWQAHTLKAARSCGWRKELTPGNAARRIRFHTSLPEDILDAAGRLRHAAGCLVQIECRDALQLIRESNFADTLIYADPPYMPGTYCKGMYGHELGEDGHMALVGLLKAHKGPVALSGYRSAAYDGALAGWQAHETTSVTQSGAVKTECLWTNYDAGGQLGMF